MKRGIASIALNAVTTTQWPQNKNFPRTLAADVLARNSPRRKPRSPHLLKRLKSIGQVPIHKVQELPKLLHDSLSRGPFE